LAHPVDNLSKASVWLYRESYISAIVLLGDLDKLDSDSVVVQLRDRFDERSNVYHVDMFK
jgi:hypothetical protein